MAITPIETRIDTRRLGLLTRLGVLLAVVALAWLAALWLGASGDRVDFAARLSPPDAHHWFGTDVMGRDLLARTLEGLGLSLRIGLLAAALGTLVALGLAVVSTLNRMADIGVGLLTDMTLGLPHLVLLMLVAFALGGGPQGVVLAIALTHWPRLTRVLRAELLQLLNADYLRVSRRFGKSRGFVIRTHVLPHLAPQCLVGFLLMFPHAILHEAALTFLGFGLSPGQPALGVMLAESLRYLSAGHWWLGVFPGAALLAMVLTFDRLGSAARGLFVPRETMP
ncbi:ABC transporter permease [Litchfieldella xinjiangensis]|uniref:ABC transporter permease n=1 Tax=Litchfieldella xinjiangensis TaxID=1166948 RepID=UPI0006947F03|nr:ABC transporter permease [Halomonas xinjiangensis]